MNYANCNRQEIPSIHPKPTQKLYECKEPKDVGRACEKGFYFGSAILCFHKIEPKKEEIQE